MKNRQVKMGVDVSGKDLGVVVTWQFSHNCSIVIQQESAGTEIKVNVIDLGKVKLLFNYQVEK